MKGFSGGTVEVRVRKTAADKSKNTRLDYEITRLNHIGQNYGPHICTPTIYQDSRLIKDGVFSYEMEYIPGLRLEDALPTMTVSEIGKTAQRLACFIMACSDNLAIPSPRGIVITPEEQFIREKLDSISLHIDPEWPESIEYTDVAKWVEVDTPTKSTMCHGDLALDNIIVSGNRLYLIDALCQGFDNYHWDIAKILQSCLCHWPTVRDNDEIYPMDESFPILGSLLLRALDEHCDHARVVLYLGTTLARIIPYAPTERQKRMLLSMSTFVLKGYLSNSFITQPVPLSEPC